MSIENSIDLVCKQLLGELSIPVKIRTREKITQNEVDELLLAIDSLIGYYKNKNSIPKRLALAFVDVYVGFNVSDDFIGEAEAQRYEDIGIAIQEKAYELFA